MLSVRGATPKFVSLMSAQQSFSADNGEAGCLLCCWRGWDSGAEAGGQPPREGKQCSALCQHLGEADGGLAVHRLPPLLPSPGVCGPGCRGGGGWFRRSKRFRVKSCAQAALILDEAVETGGTGRETGQRNQETRSHMAPRARLSQTTPSCHFPVYRMRTATNLFSYRTV